MTTWQKAYVVLIWVALLTSSTFFLIREWVFPGDSESLLWGYRMGFVTLVFGSLGASFVWTHWNRWRWLRRAS
jgi:hypothetical protein